MPRSEPWYPSTKLTYGQLYFFIKQKTFSLNPFDKVSINEARTAILREAKEVSPDFKMFLKAATMATGLGERSIKNIIYKGTT